MVAILGFNREQIRDAVSNMYTQVANDPDAGFHFPVGRRGCHLIGYSDALLEGIPDSAVESFAGVSCPFDAGVVKSGDRVLDLGAGSGTDSLIAAALVGAHGRVFALDSTEAMRQKFAGTLAGSGVANVQILEGDAENIPLPDASVDAITSNGVLNLVPDKYRAAREMFRVLRPGGRVQIADVVIRAPVTPACKDDPALWAECVVGASIDEVYLDLFRDAGFVDVEIIRRDDYFVHSPSEETREVASRFGGHAVVLRMRRGEATPSALTRLSRRLDPRRLAAAVKRRGLAGMLALGMALLACYGTLAVAALLPLLGVGVVIHEGAWAGAVAVFATLACVVIAAGQRVHGSPAPAVPALGGTLLILYAMFVDFHVVTELAGFALLAAGAIMDYAKRNRLKPSVPGGESSR